MLVLGIETSCDETAAALVTDGREICANVVLSQLDEHAPYGGIVPEIAARSHIEHLDGGIARAMAEAGAEFADIDLVAVTIGPGAFTGLRIGLAAARGLALAAGLPCLGVATLEAVADGVVAAERNAGTVLVVLETERDDGYGLYLIHV